VNQPQAAKPPIVPPNSPPRSDRRFDHAFHDLAPRVRGYLRRLTGGDTAEAEDVTQEVFLAAYTGRESYRGSAPPLAWLLGIARRRWRDRSRGAHLEQVEMPEEIVGAIDPADQVVRAQHLQGCLDQLTTAERDALLLVFSQGLTYAEAAVTLGEPIGTVKWRVHAASRRMRELLRSGDEEKLP
jgi:RNA polymerase sigma-70 factor (ECF subfamily)